MAKTIEQVLWSQLRARKFYNVYVKRQTQIGPFMADFYLPNLKIVIELIDDLGEMRQRKLFYFNQLGLEVLSVAPEEVMSNMENVLNKLKALVQLQSGRRRV